MQRLRLTFGRDHRLKYISHLDMMRMWERGFRRAQIPLAYSEGFSPHPKIAAAAPLAVGMSSICELLDVQLEAPIPATSLIHRLGEQLPPGLWVVAAKGVDPGAASMASVLRFAEYEVGLSTDLSDHLLAGRLAYVLAAEALPRERKRDKQTKRYDLRPLIDDLRLIDDSCSKPTIWMRLHAGPSAAGRPEEVVAELGIRTPPRSIKRVRLILETDDGKT